MEFTEIQKLFKERRQQIYNDHLPIDQGGGGLSYTALTKKYNITISRVVKICKREEHEAQEPTS